VCYGAPERPAARALRVDVYPLVVAGGIREEVDLLLGDLALATPAKVRTSVVRQVMNVDAKHDQRQ
jgi:hypothetical protein